MRKTALQLDKFQRIRSAWADMRRDKSFAKMTLAQFEASVQPSLEVRKKIADLRSALIAALSERHTVDLQSAKSVAKVVKAVQADLEDGDDGELYQAMGYVRASDRKRGSRKFVPLSQAA